MAGKKRWSLQVLMETFIRLTKGEEGGWGRYTHLLLASVILTIDHASLSRLGGGVHVMHGRSCMTIDPGRNMSGFHRPGNYCLHRARSVVGLSASRMEGRLHPGGGGGGGEGARGACDNLPQVSRPWSAPCSVGNMNKLELELITYAVMK